MSSKRNVGPLDKRKQLTRCQSCARRRIKCQGGFPCEYCIRTKKTCLPQDKPVVKAKFVYGNTLQVVAHVTTKSEVKYLDYFSVFMKRCQFTNDSADSVFYLLPLIQTCASLQEAVIAIGALEASRRATVKFTSERQSPGIVALHSYGTSIRKLQAELESLEASQCQGVLWCTLLLGLFDLMTQVTGDQWAKHMLYGTSRILRTFSMMRPIDRLGKQFLGVFNWLEASRAILYCEETILSQRDWPQYGYLTPTQASQVNTIFELFVQVSSFSKFFFDRIESIPESRRVYDPDISHLACEGRAHQQRLQDWHSQHLGDRDVYCKLEVAISHALQLLICMNYTFYACWDEETIPKLTTREIESHVSAIVYFAGQVLGSSNIPGILMLFPLRMAGANTNDRSKKDRILRLLEQISQTGFIVSNRIIVDLEEVWAYKALHSIGQ